MTHAMDADGPNQVKLDYASADSSIKSNGFAASSLVLAIVGLIVPVFVLSALAILFGGLGVRRANRSAAGGKGMSVAGILLGVLGLFWSAIFLYSLILFLQSAMRS